jgi:hypothetical protein
LRVDVLRHGILDINPGIVFFNDNERNSSNQQLRAQRYDDAVDAEPLDDQAAHRAGYGAGGHGHEHRHPHVHIVLQQHGQKHRAQETCWSRRTGHAPVRKTQLMPMESTATMDNCLTMFHQGCYGNRMRGKNGEQHEQQNGDQGDAQPFHHVQARSRRSARVSTRIVVMRSPSFPFCPESGA